MQALIQCLCVGSERERESESGRDLYTYDVSPAKKYAKVVEFTSCQRSHSTIFDTDMNVMGSAPKLPKASVESSGSYGSDYSYYSDSDSAAKDSRFDQNQLG